MLIALVIVSILLLLLTTYNVFRLLKSRGRVYSCILISTSFLLIIIIQLYDLHNLLFNSGVSLNNFIKITGFAFSLLAFIGITKLNPFITGNQESRDKRFNMFENIMEGYQVIDREWRYVYVNEAVSEQGREQKKNLIGNKMTDVYPGIENTGIFRILKHSMDNRIPRQIDNEFSFPDGYSAWFNLNIQPVPEGISIHSIDITKHKLSERMFLEMQKIAGIGNWIFDLRTGNVTFSDEIYSLFGIDRKEFEDSKNPIDIICRHIHPDDRQQFRSACKNPTVDINQKPPLEYRIIVPGQKERIVYIKGYLESEDKLKPVRMIVFVQDITERKITEKKLLESSEHLRDLIKKRTAELEKVNTDLQTEITVRKRVDEELAHSRDMLWALIDCLPDEVYAKDINSRFIMVNLQVLRSFSCSSFKDILGKTDFDLLPREKADTIYIKEQAIFDGNIDVINYEEQFTDSNGNTRWYSVTKVPMRDKEGNISGLVGINKDITEFKNIETILLKSKEEAENANKAKSTFLSSMSHEIRTPMNTIMGFTDLLLQEEDMSPEHKQWLKTIDESGQHLFELINDILEISRIEAGRVTYNPSNVDLFELLHIMKIMFQDIAETKGLSLIFHYADNLEQYFITDENKLKQILINLIGNAVKFTEKGSIIIQVHTATSEDAKLILTIEIEDTGPGIKEDEMDKLFQMFGQAEAGTKEGGTGLGLAISSQHARIMGGDILVNSIYGKGSCFILKIPVERGEEPPKKISHTEHVSGLKPDQPRYKILIVDDIIDNRTLCKEILKPAGFDLEEACNGIEALDKYKSWYPDIILLDIRMPEMDGYEVIRRIRENGDSKTGIIAITANAFLKDRQKILDAGADAYLRKPFKEFELFNCLHSYFGIDFVYGDDKK